MLCQFSFKNFKSFRNEGTLDMQAAPISEHEDSLLVDADGQKFLPLAAIYGPNGSGKTTAINCMLALLKYEQGNIQIFGQDMNPDAYEIKQNIGVVMLGVIMMVVLTLLMVIRYLNVYIK